MQNIVRQIYERKRGITAIDILIGAIIFLCLITVSSVLGFQVGATEIEILIIFVAGICTCLTLSGPKIINSYLNIFVPIMLFTLVECVYYPAGAMHWIRIVLLLFTLTGISVFIIKKNIRVIEIFYNIFLFMIILNMIIYILVAVLQISIPYQLFTKDWLPEFKNYLFVFYDRAEMMLARIGPFTIIRNEGIYTEPGLLAVLLDVELVIYYFGNVKKRKWQLVLILIALITTVSTTGLALAMLIIGYYMLEGRRIKNQYSKLAILGAVFMICLVAIAWLLKQKILHAGASYSLRSSDIIYGLKLFAEKPLMGWGFRNLDIYGQVMMEHYGFERYNSNAVASFLYQLGIVGCAVFYVPIITTYKRIPKINTKEKRKYLFLVGVFLLISMSEPIIDSAFMLLVIGYLYARLICNSSEQVTA